MKLPVRTFCRSLLSGSLAVVLLAAVLLAAGCDRVSVSPDASDADAAKISDIVFTQTISQTDKDVLVKFGAPWCGPCVQVDAELKKLAAQVGDDVEILKINVDENGEIAGRYEVSSIPKLVLFRDGKPISNRIGYMDADELARWISNTR